jgi:hypothetical protein
VLYEGKFIFVKYARKTVARFLSSLVLCWLGIAGIGACAQPFQDKPPDTKPADTFFAGTVTELTDVQITVARTVQGKMEKRSFQITEATKVEGKLRLRVRVTVRYITDEDDSDTATLIVVRSLLPAKKR